MKNLLRCKFSTLKKLLFILFCFFIQFGYGQNWELFPYQQKSFYTRSPRDYDVDLFEINQDSMWAIGGETFLFFNKKSSISNLQECYDEVCSFSYQGLDSPEANQYDSLFLRNDTTFFYSEFGSLPFYFLNKSLPGDSWAIINDFAGPDYDSVIIVCESADEELIFGQTDSVKTYSIHSTGPMAGENIIDGMQLKLSKSFGLINFLKFSSFSINSIYMESYPVYSLVGIKKDGINYGFVLPDWKDYFHYQPGDIRKFYFPTDSWPPVYKYRLDTIVSVLYSEDSIIYQYNYSEYSTAGAGITYGTNISEKYYKNSLQYILEGGEKWPVFGSYSPINQLANYTGDNISIYFNSILKLDSIILEDQTVVDRLYGSNFSGVGIPSCYVFDAVDAGNGFGFNSFLGYTGYCEWYADGLGPCYNLIGAKIGDVEWGDLSFPNSISKNIAEKTVNVFPNPSTGILNIKTTGYENGAYSIFDLNGILLESDLIRNKQINIENLKPGIYFIIIQNENETLRGKFIKQ